MTNGLLVCVCVCVACVLCVKTVIDTLCGSEEFPMLQSAFLFNSSSHVCRECLALGVYSEAIEDHIKSEIPNNVNFSPSTPRQLR